MNTSGLLSVGQHVYGLYPLYNILVGERLVEIGMHMPFAPQRGSIVFMTFCSNGAVLNIFEKCVVTRRAQYFEWARHNGYTVFEDDK